MTRTGIVGSGAVNPVSGTQIGAGEPLKVRHYRPDIDGLRALAVVPVVIFHLGSTLLKGGYIGVDVFFVISGYLITGILHAEIEAANFSVLRFYDRRIRRIFPALFALLFACIVPSIWLLLPPEIIDFAHSAIATTLFASNIYFMQVTDYFSTGADSNPLLHTWSLAVEEQFYIAFPIILYFISRIGRKAVIGILGALTLASFLLSVKLVQGHQVAAFYLAPSRAWELLIGALLALGICPNISSRILREGLAATGLILIVAGCMMFYQTMPFPGVRALVPCLGAAFIIQAGSSGATLTGRLLSTRPIVFIGLISFSLYLWHWPIIVFCRIWSSQPLSFMENVAIFILSCAIATLSWHYIERPFRSKNVMPSPFMLRGFAVASMACVLAIGIGLVASHGLADDFPARVVRLANFLNYDDRPVYRRGTCFLDSHSSPLADYDEKKCLTPSPGQANLLLIGDSHAAHLWSGLAAAFPAANVLQATASGCKPVFGGKGHPTCLAIMQRALDAAMTDDRIGSVLLSARWTDADIAPLVATIDRLAKHVGHIYVSGPIVEYQKSLPRILAQASAEDNRRLLISERLGGQKTIDEHMASALAGHKAIYLSPYQTMCKDSAAACQTLAPDGTPMQWDYGHLTGAGSIDLVSSWRTKGAIVLTR